MTEEPEVITLGGFEFNWKKGAPEVATLSVFFAVVLGLPLLLFKQQLLTIPSVIFYVILFIIGFFGHVDDVNQEAYDRVVRKDIYLAFALGLIGFLVIQVLFFLGLTLLATSEGTLTMDKWELLIFNLTFVIGAEELVFRDSFPFIFSQALGRVMRDDYAIILSFGLSSIIFGSLHIWTYGFDTLAVGKAIISGIILSVIRIFGGLLSSYIAHMTYNSLNILGMYALII